MYPTPVDPTALFLMGRKGMGDRRPFRSVRRNIFGMDQYDGYEPQERSGLPQEFEDYIDPASVALMLKGMRKDAIAQGLVGAGSALLGAPDLASGLSAGAQAFSTPFFEYKNQAREIPIQMAQARYGFAGEEERRERERGQEGRLRRLFDFDVQRGEHEGRMAPLIEKGQRYDNAKRKLGIQTDRYELDALPGRLQDEADIRNRQIQEFDQKYGQSEQSFPLELDYRRALTNATRAGAHRDWTHVPEGGISPSTKLTFSGGTEEDLAQQVGAGNIPSRSQSIQKGRLYLSRYNESAALDPNQAVEVSPTDPIVEAVLWDISNKMSKEELRRKWGNTPIAADVVEAFLWDQEQDMGRGR